MSKFERIAAEGADHEISKLTELLEVSRSPATTRGRRGNDPLNCHRISNGAAIWK